MKLCFKKSAVLGLVAFACMTAQAADFDQRIMTKVDSDHRSEVQAGKFAQTKARVAQNLKDKSAGRSIASVTAVPAPKEENYRATSNPGVRASALVSSSSGRATVFAAAARPSVKQAPRQIENKVEARRVALKNSGERH